MEEPTRDRFRGWTDSLRVGFRQLLRLAASVVGVVVLVGCGRTSVEVALPADASAVMQGEVVSGGMIVGRVVGLDETSAGRVATVEFNERDLAEMLLRPGVAVWIESGDGGDLLEFDVTDAGEGEIPSGTVLVAKRRDPIDRAEAYAQRWARNGTLVAVGVGAIIALILVFVLRSLLGSIGGLIMIVFSMMVASGLAYLVNGLAASTILEFVYPHLGRGPASLPEDLGLPPDMARGLADPRVVAFLLVGFPLFLIIMGLIRSVTSPRRAGKGKA